MTSSWRCWLAGGSGAAHLLPQLHAQLQLPLHCSLGGFVRVVDATPQRPPRSLACVDVPQRQLLPQRARQATQQELWSVLLIGARCNMQT